MPSTRRTGQSEASGFGTEGGWRTLSKALAAPTHQASAEAHAKARGSRTFCLVNVRAFLFVYSHSGLRTDNEGWVRKIARAVGRLVFASDLVH